MFYEEVSEESDLDLIEEEDTTMEDIREEHWRDVDEYCEDKKNIYSLRWAIYTRYKENLTKREFLVSILHPKGGEIVWTCVKDTIT